jgi:hypothetical protein
MSDYFVLLDFEKYHTKRITSHSLTLGKRFVLFMSNNYVLLDLERYHTNCHGVRHTRKTKHQAYQETNAVDRRRLYDV